MENDVPPRRIGRPPRYSGRRQTFSFRITDEMRQQLIGAVRISGRSLSEEVEYRVARSFLEDRWEERMRETLSKLLHPDEKP